MGVFPRVAQWDDDGLFDLILGIADGTIRFYKNLGGGIFDDGTPLEVGPPGEKVLIDVGSRCTVCITDWNEDGRRDLLLGAYDAKFHLFLNTGGDFAPEYESEILLPGPGGDLSVVDSRSSPDMFDLDGDGAKDLLSGDNEGRLIFFPNRGANSAPLFDYGYPIESASVPFDLDAHARTRPRICDFNADGHIDILTGSYWSLVHLLPGGDYTPDGVPEWAAAAPARLDAWPNPFNPATTLSYVVPEGGARVELAIYDSSGRRIRRLFAGPAEEGRREILWHGLDDAGRRMSSGLYIARLDINGRVARRKLLLLE